MKVMYVDVDEDTVQPHEDLATEGREALWEWQVSGTGEQRLVVDLRLDPVHQVADIVFGRKRRRLFKPREPIERVLFYPSHTRDN